MAWTTLAPLQKALEDLQSQRVNRSMVLKSSIRLGHDTRQEVSLFLSPPVGAGNWANLSIADCATMYHNANNGTFTTLVIVSDYVPKSNESGGILAIGAVPGFTPKGSYGPSQLCPNDFLDSTPGYLYSNSTLPLIKAEANGENLAYSLCSGYAVETPRNDIEPQAEYCLLYREPPSMCKLQFSSIALQILYYAVIAKASLMTTATVYLFFHFKTDPIFNVGDAMASYLEHPENSPNSISCNQTWAKSWPTAISFLGDVRKPTLSKEYCKRSFEILIAILDWAHMMKTRKRIRRLTIRNIHGSDENEVIPKAWIPNGKGSGWYTRLYYYSWTLAIITAATTMATVPEWREHFSTLKSSEDTVWIIEVLFYSNILQVVFWLQDSMYLLYRNMCESRASLLSYTSSSSALSVTSPRPDTSQSSTPFLTFTKREFILIQIRSIILHFWASLIISMSATSVVPLNRNEPSIPAVYIYSIDNSPSNGIGSFTIKIAIPLVLNASLWCYAAFSEADLSGTRRLHPFLRGDTTSISISASCHPPSDEGDISGKEITWGCIRDQDGNLQYPTMTSKPVDEVEWTQEILNDLAFPRPTDHNRFDVGEMAVLCLDFDYHIPTGRINQKAINHVLSVRLLCRVLSRESGSSDDGERYRLTTLTGTLKYRYNNENLRLWNEYMDGEKCGSKFGNEERETGEGEVVKDSTFLSLLNDLLSSSPTKNSDTYHIFGQSLAGFETDDVPSESPNQNPYSLEQQIDLVHDCLVEQINGSSTPYKNVILIGHSVGSYILLETLSKLIAPAANPSISAALSGILLFPTVTHIARSPSGAKLTPLMSIPNFPALASSTAKMLLYCAPNVVLDFLVKKITGMPEEAAKVTTSFLRSKNGIWQALYLARDEMNIITDDKWDSEIWGVEHSESSQSSPPKLIFYFGENDHWVASHTRDALIAARASPVPESASSTSSFSIKENNKPIMMIDKEGIDHGFCINHSETMATKVKDWIDKITQDA
ncbi:hypothetical protein BHYA_0032g00040 [Botrytis hyacinthi]|uniref:Uncharacterized protein n=1 Tax=Botrytis hyacinthi TaxID=278943 RepID=A0A4Z1GVR1_9HELO|nr:hypothetical protein BHYA_0032g00040 [Botrytis hyacinthi]